MRGEQLDAALGAHEPEPARQLEALHRDVDPAGVVAQPGAADRGRLGRPAQRIEPALEALERALGGAVGRGARPAREPVHLRVREHQALAGRIHNESEALDFYISVDLGAHRAPQS